MYLIYSISTHETYLIFVFLSYLFCRGSQYGGDGTLGPARWHGHCMGLWLHNLETLLLGWMKVNWCKNLSDGTLGLGMIS